MCIKEVLKMPNEDVEPGDRKYCARRSQDQERFEFKVIKELSQVQVFGKPLHPRPGVFSQLRVINGASHYVGQVVDLETHVDGKMIGVMTWVIIKSEGYLLGIRLSNFRNLEGKTIDLL